MFCLERFGTFLDVLIQNDTCYKVMKLLNYSYNYDNNENNENGDDNNNKNNNKHDN